ncbi:carboxypeptidase-like regulatory domain-containing protein [Euzebyella marina]|nr:tetratricopeptide repeat protein [Euzebyella marina]
MITGFSYSQTQNFSVKGIVRNTIGEPMANVNIKIKGTPSGTQTDSNGRYRIEINRREVLLFSHIGYENLEKLVEAETQDLNIQMEIGTTELDEVVLEKKKSHSQKSMLENYMLNPNLIKTRLGIIDKDRMSYPIQIIQGSDLITAGPDFLYSLKSFYPRMEVVREDGHVKVFLQKLSYSEPKNAAIFDVDGIIQETAPTYLHANDIERIAVLVRGAAAARYGPQGSQGVIIVNTKGQAKIDDMGVDRRYNNETLKDSLISAVNTVSMYRNTLPNVICGFERADSKDMAIELYQLKIAENVDNPYYFLESSRYFYDKWGDLDIATEILGRVETDFSKNLPVLRAVAFYYEEFNAYKRAISAYCKVLRLQPKMAQSYRDLVNCYAEIGNYRVAVYYYVRYKNMLKVLPENEVESLGADYPFEMEVEKIMSKWKGLNINNHVKSVSSDNQVRRLVLEWNVSKIDLTFQFKNDLGGYDDWSNFDNPEMNKNGYLYQDFFFDVETGGKWIVNIKNLKNNTFSPFIYIKATSYNNYGLPNQTKNEKVFRFGEDVDNVQLFIIDI